jgi:hypothetical protein
MLIFLRRFPIPETRSVPATFSVNLVPGCKIYHEIYHLLQCQGKGKGKTIPLQAWTGPEGSRRLKLPDFKTIGT